MAMPSDSGYHGRYGGKNALSEVQPPSSSSNTGLVLALGGAAVLSATTGLVLFLSHHDQPAKPEVKVGVSPNGVVLSGTLP